MTPPPLESTQEEQETRRDRGSRGQGEMKRRRISGMFSASPSRQNSDSALATRAQGLSTDEQPPEQDDKEAREEGEEKMVPESILPPRSATLVEDIQLDTPTSEAAPEADESDPIPTISAPLGVPGSPPVIPLTESDPLLDDRLRTLSTIWEVLGSNVARSLPAVATAEAVRRASVTGSIRSREAIVEGLNTPNQEYEPVIPDADLASLPALPPSTVSLLDDLAEDARARERLSALGSLLNGQTDQAAQSLDTDLPAIVIPPTPDTRSEVLIHDPVPNASASDGLLHPPSMAPVLTTRPSASSLLSTATATTDVSSRSAVSGPGSTAGSTQDRRRGRIGGLAERVGSWFGIGGGDGNAESTRPTLASSGEGTQTAPDAPATSSAAPTPEVPAGRPRLPQGAVMIVQGFVQTSITPNRDNNNAAEPSEADVTQPTTASPVRPDFSSRSSSTQDAIPSSEEPQTPSERINNRPGTPRPADSFISRDPEGDRPASPERRPGRSGRAGIWGRYRSQANYEREAPNFSDQARMLAGLLSVATAATASSLLALPGGSDAPTASDNTEATPSAPASGPRATLAALRRRLQNSNANSAPAATEETGLESVLRSYMQRAMDGNSIRSTNNGETGTSTGDANTDDDRPALATILPDAEEASFEEFLNNMQYSLIRSLREFNGDPTLRVAAAANTSAVPGTEAPPAQETQISSNTSESPTGSAAPAEPTDRVPSPTAMDVDDDRESVHSTASARYEPPEAEASAAEDPPRLSFFRMFQFPARDQPAPTTAPASGEPPAPTSLIPAVIVGVRSISRDISTITGQTASQAPFPFSDAADMQDHTQDEATPASATGTTDTTTAASTENSNDTNTPTTNTADPATTDQTTDGAESSTPTTGAQAAPTNRMMRVIRALVQRDGQRARQAEAQAASARAAASVTNNYVIWVVGGNYPAGHPILTIPHLFTGELNHEDLWALAEAMGQAKPPVATKDDIAKAGLRVIKGSEIETAVKTGQVHDMCLDRCLVSRVCVN